MVQHMYIYKLPNVDYKKFEDICGCQRRLYHWPRCIKEAWMTVCIQLLYVQLRSSDCIDFNHPFVPHFCHKKSSAWNTWIFSILYINSTSIWLKNRVPVIVVSFTTGKQGFCLRRSRGRFPRFSVGNIALSYWVEVAASELIELNKPSLNKVRAQ